MTAHDLPKPADVSPASVGDHAGWRPAISAPEGVEIIVGDERAENIAISHYAEFRWWLGGPNDHWREQLDFEPHWWLPRDWPANPFRTAIPAQGKSA